MTLPTRPVGFESLKASAKADWVWHTLIGKSVYKPVERPPLTLAKPWVLGRIAGPRKVLARTLDRTDDLMESGRPKIIHTQGSVAMIEFEPVDDSLFTGVLASPGAGGGATGLVRMSLAVPPTGKAAITPGLGLKLFVDGKPSLDLLAMNHTVGQGRDFNLFSNTFTHDLRDEHTELRPPQKLLQLFFKRVSSQPRRLTIDHLASTDRTGEPIDEPNVPHRLVFRPHQDVRTVFRGRQGEDYRETLERIEPGSILYSVEVVQRRTNEANQVIGHLRATTRFTSSEGGDRLFFRHMTDPQDRVDQNPATNAER